MKHNGISSAVQKELEARNESTKEYRQEVYDRLKRLRKYKRRKKCPTVKMFISIIGCSKCQ